MDRQYKNILATGSKELENLKGQTFDVIDVKCPSSIDYAVQLAKVISKLSPLIGNLIEFSTVDLLNQHDQESLGLGEATRLKRSNHVGSANLLLRTR